MWCVCVHTFQCWGRRRGEEASSRDSASLTPQRMMDLASVWANTRESASISHDTCSRLRPVGAPITPSHITPSQTTPHHSPST